ncbi:hypothetical protein HAX54_009466, partial [Datura stramonium]|nr:hypothetical protein [Datura stramonium]
MVGVLLRRRRWDGYGGAREIGEGFSGGWFMVGRRMSRWREVWHGGFRRWCATVLLLPSQAVERKREEKKRKGWRQREG